MFLLFCFCLQNLEWQDVIAAGRIERPVLLTHCGDNRRFIVEQRGRIWILQQGILQAAPFLDIRDQVFFENERGLLSLAFSPDFSQSGYFFITYVRASDQSSVLARVQVAKDAKIADPSSQEMLMILPQPSPHQFTAISPKSGRPLCSPSGRIIEPFASLCC